MTGKFYICRVKLILSRHRSIKKKILVATLICVCAYLCTWVCVCLCVWGCLEGHVSFQALKALNDK